MAPGRGGTGPGGREREALHARGAPPHPRYTRHARPARRLARQPAATRRADDPPVQALAERRARRRRVPRERAAFAFPGAGRPAEGRAEPAAGVGFHREVEELLFTPT